MIHCALRHSVRHFEARKLFVQTAAVHADSDRNVAFSQKVGQNSDFFVVADISGIYPYFVRAGLCRRNSQPVIEVYVRHERHARFLFKIGKSCRVPLVPNCQPHYVATRFFELLNLRQSRPNV